MAKHRRAGFEDHFGPKIVLGPSEMVLKKFEDQNGPQIWPTVKHIEESVIPEFDPFKFNYFLRWERPAKGHKYDDHRVGTNESKHEKEWSSMK